jgi:CheY-like chemotaxis protein
VIQTANTEVDVATAARHAGLGPGRFVTLTVSDTGHGMTPEVLSHVFEPFFTTKEVGKGTGLGLATVYGIVKQSGGYIAIESKPDAGATFRIYLPRVAAARTEGASVRSAPTATGSETVLLVEDEASLRTLARELLETNGYRVIDAGSGWEALATVEAHPEPIDLLLTDVVMPNMSGTELADRLKTLRPEIAVLYMSGYTDDALGRHGALAPGTLLLHKPFDEQNLTRRVREALARVATTAV